MWEAIKDILTSSNAVSVILFLILCIIVAFVLIKTNLLQIHTESVRIGARDSERNIIRQQTDYVWQHLQEAEANLEKDDDYDEQLGKIVIMSCYIEYVNWITFNHLTRSDAYISVKQKRLVSIVNSLTVNSKYKSEDFIEYIKSDTRNTIYDLLKIREVYKDN